MPQLCECSGPLWQEMPNALGQTKSGSEGFWESCLQNLPLELLPPPFKSTARLYSNRYRPFRDLHHHISACSHFFLFLPTKPHSVFFFSVQPDRIFKILTGATTGYLSQQMCQFKSLIVQPYHDLLLEWNYEQVLRKFGTGKIFPPFCFFPF